MGVSQDKQAGQGRVGGRTAHVGGAEVPGSLLWGLGLIPSVGSMGLAIGDPDTPWVWDSSVGSLGNPTHHGFGIHWFDHWGPQHITGLGSICGVIGDPNTLRVRDPSVGTLGTPKHHGFGIHWFDHWGSQHITGLGSIQWDTGDPNAPWVWEPWIWP